MSKHGKDLSPTAIGRTPGKSFKEVLFATSDIRHTAVHRLWTSATGIMNLVNAAIGFVEMLKDAERADQIKKIKSQLAANMEEIIQYQNLLKRKLSDELRDLAKEKS